MSSLRCTCGREFPLRHDGPVVPAPLMGPQHRGLLAGERVAATGRRTAVIWAVIAAYTVSVCPKLVACLASNAVAVGQAALYFVK
jgi:hypothetical protein